MKFQLNQDFGLQRSLEFHPQRENGVFSQGFKEIMVLTDQPLLKFPWKTDQRLVFQQNKMEQIVCLCIDYKQKNRFELKQTQ